MQSECNAGIKGRKARRHVSQGRDARRRKDFESCISSARQAIELDSRSAQAKALLKECTEKKELASP